MAALELSSALGGLYAHVYAGKLRTRARDQTFSSEHQEFSLFPGMIFGPCKLAGSETVPWHGSEHTMDLGMCPIKATLRGLGKGKGGSNPTDMTCFVSNCMKMSCVLVFTLRARKKGWDKLALLDLLV